MKSIYIYGASGHGLVVADIAKASGYEEIIYIDDGDNDYLKFEDIKSNTSINIALGIGNNFVRKKIYDKLDNAGFNIITLIHPSAIISPSVKIGKGTVIMPNTVINANSKIGIGVILNTTCIIEHENTIEDFVHISPNVALAGNVRVKELTHIGIGSKVIQGIIIGKKAVVGAGSVVVKNINDLKKAFGNPCKNVGEMNE